MAIDAVEYAGWPAVRMATGSLVVVLATGFGPRIVGLEADDSGNLLAVLPNAVIERDDGPPFHFRGGHRLWVAPEVPAVSYRPDDEPVEIEDHGARLVARGQVDEVTGLRRTIEVLSTGEAELTVRHRIANEGQASARVAPWAITQLPLGGTATMPLRGGDSGATGDDQDRLPDRLLVLWPYTRFDDPRLRVTDDAVTVHAARPADPWTRVKVGSAGGNALDYQRAGWRVTKRAHVLPGRYGDLGASMQVYADEAFIELETVGPVVDLVPGSEVDHVEHWRVTRVDGAG